MYSKLVDALGYHDPLIEEVVNTVGMIGKADWMVEYAKCRLCCYLFTGIRYVAPYWF